MDHSAAIQSSVGLLSAPVLRPQWITLYVWSPWAGGGVELRFPIRDMERARYTRSPEPGHARLQRLSREVIPAARIFLDRMLGTGETWQSLAAQSPITVRLPH